MQPQSELPKTALQNLPAFRIRPIRIRRPFEIDWQAAFVSPTLQRAMLFTLQLFAALSASLLAQAPAPGLMLANTEPAR